MTNVTCSNSLFVFQDKHHKQQQWQPTFEKLQKAINNTSLSVWKPTLLPFFILGSRNLQENTQIQYSYFKQVIYLNRCIVVVLSLSCTG